MQTHEGEPRLVVQTEGDIHRLDAVARRAFHEVIDRTEGDDTIAPRVEGEPHVGEVRSGKELRLGIAPDARAFLDDANERLGGVRIAVDLPERLLVDRGGRVDVRRRKDAAHELDRSDREIDARVVSTG